MGTSLVAYTTPDLVKEISDIGAVVLAATAVLSLIWMIAKIAVYLDRRRTDQFARRVIEVIQPAIDRLYDHIDQRTTPIQPGENGGESLADIHKRLDPIEAKLGLKERRDPHHQSLPDLMELPDLD